MSTKIWSRDFTLAVAANSFVTLVFYVLMSAMTLYAVDEFAANDTMSGLTSSMFVIGSVVARLFAGRLLDIIGRRRLLLVGMVVFVLASAAYAFVDELALLLVVRFVHGMAFGGSNTAVAASVQGLIPPERRSEGTGYFGLSTTLAMAVGPLLAVTWSAAGDYDTIFLFCTVASAIGTVIAWVLRLPEREVSAAERAGWWRMRPSDFFDRGAMPIATIMLLTGVAYSAILTFLAAYAVHRDMAQAASGFFVVYAVTVLGARLVIGRVQDRLGDNYVMYPTLAAFVLSLLGLAWSPNPVVFALCGALAGFGFGGMMSCAQAIVSAGASPARIGVVTSTFFVFLDVGCGVGPIFLGVLVGMVEFEGMYVALAALVVVTIALYWWLHGRLQGAKVGVASTATHSEAGTSALVGRRVLVGFDGSQDGLRALRYAATAANVAGYDLWVVNAVESPGSSGDLGVHVDASALASRGEAVLDAARALLAEERFPAEQTVLETVVGHPVAVLAERSDRAVLLVLGRRSTSGLERMFVGSTSVGVVSGAGCPVVVISADSTPHASTRHGVVTVAVGARGGDRGAIAWGLAEARRRHATLRVVHVRRPGSDEAELRERALARLEELSDSYRDVEILVDLPHGSGRSPVDELVEISRVSDVLVLDGRGNRVTGLPLGGAVRGAMAHAHCPVILVN